MLDIKISRSYSEPKWEQWEANKPFPITEGDSSFATEVIADGGELHIIRDRIKGMPDAPGKSSRWYGDHAKFICAFLARAWKWV